MNLEIKKKPIISNEQLKECLGACAGCDQMSGAADVTMSKSALNPQPKVRVPCKALAGKDGKPVSISPMRTVASSKDCKHRRRFFGKGAERQYNPVANFAALSQMVMGRSQSQSAPAG